MKNNSSKPIKNNPFIWSSGVNTTILAECKEESSKFGAIGATIMFTGLFAAASGGYAFFQVFNKADNDFTWGAVALGLLWGAMIFNLDRYIVMSIRKKGKWYQQFLTALPRIFLAIIISLVVAKPLEVRLFQDRIEAQITDNELQKRERDINSIYNITGKGQIDSLKQLTENQIARIETQLANDCPTADCKTAFTEMRTAKSVSDKTYNRTSREYNQAIKDIKWILNPKNLDDGIILIIDGKEIKDVTPEGKRKLEKARRTRNRLQSERSKVYNSYISKKKIYDNLNKLYKEGLRADLDIKRKEDSKLTVEKIEADSTSSILEKKSSKSANIAYTNNFITQVEALGDLTKYKVGRMDSDGNVIEPANNSMYFMSWAIIILFIVVETSPIFVKLIAEKSKYDELLELEETKYRKDIEIKIEANKSLLELEASIAEAQQKHNHHKELKKIDSKDNEIEIRSNLAEHALTQWEAIQLQKINNGNLTPSELLALHEEFTNENSLTNLTL